METDFEDGLTRLNGREAGEGSLLESGASEVMVERKPSGVVGLLSVGDRWLGELSLSRCRLEKDVYVRIVL